MNLKRIYLLFLLSSAFLPAKAAEADTVYFKNGGEEKGIVVENLHDRILLNTVEGERQINKSDIKDILYDNREQNLVKLGDFHLEKGNIIKAYTYYRKACQVNPNSKEAQDKFIHIRSVLLRRPERQIREDISRRQALFKEVGTIYEPKILEGVPASLEERLKSSTGLEIISENEMPRVESVSSGSPADKAGIKKGDFIFALWGRLTGYMDLKTVETMIMESPTPEIAVSAKREISIRLTPNKERGYGGAAEAGLSMRMEEEGLTIFDVKGGSPAARDGLVKGDLIITIEDRPTRYMPFNDAVRLIDEASARGVVKIEILRDATLWKKES